MYKRLTEMFVHTLTPCILHKYSCVFDCHIYMNWSALLRKTGVLLWQVMKFLIVVADTNVIGI